MGNTAGSHQTRVPEEAAKEARYKFTLLTPSPDRKESPRWWVPASKEVVVRVQETEAALCHGDGNRGAHRRPDHEVVPIPALFVS